MSTKHTEKYKDSDGRWKEEVTTKYTDNTSKTVTSDISDRNLLGGDKVESVTRTDSHGNSSTRHVR